MNAWCWTHVSPQHRLEDLSLIRGLQERDPDNGFPYYLEAAQLCHYGDKAGAWRAIAAGNNCARVDLLPLYPAAALDDLVAAGKEPEDALAGSVLSQYADLDGSVYFDLFENLYPAAHAAGNREQLAALWLQLCRLGHSRGVSRGLSNTCCQDLRTMLNDLPALGLPGGTKGSSFTNLSSKLSLAESGWCNSALRSYRAGGTVAQGSTMWMDALLDNLIQFSSQDYASIQSHYSGAVEFRRAFVSGGIACSALEELEDYDLLNFRWKAGRKQP